MTTYRVATGHNVVLGSLTVLSPQPRSEGMKYTRVNAAASGVVYKEAPYVELVWDLLADATAYQALLTTFGLGSVESATVTVYIRSDKFSWVRMNGRAVRPEVGRGVTWDRYFPRNITILIRDLETAS